MNWVNKIIKIQFLVIGGGSILLHGNEESFKQATSETKNSIHKSLSDNNYTKMVVIDKNKKWLYGKYLLGEINLCKQNIINAYLTAQGIITNQDSYNIADITEIKYIQENTNNNPNENPLQNILYRHCNIPLIN